MKRLAPHGLTLIELTVSMVIVLVLFGAALVGVGAVTGSRARSAVGELGGVMRSLYDTAALTGKTCRLVLDLGATEKSDELQYRAECAEGAVTRSAESLDPVREHERIRHDEQARPEDKLPFPKATDAPSLEDIAAREKSRVEESAKFAVFTSPEIQPRKLSGIRVRVSTPRDTKPITHGIAYVYFFPQGYTERTHIIFEQGQNVWTLKIAPLTGKTSVVSGAVEVKP